MNYVAIDGTKYVTDNFSETEAAKLVWLYGEARSAASLTEFQNITGHGIIQFAKSILGDSWEGHPLYKIQLDLVARVSVRCGESKGEISDQIQKDLFC